MSRRKISICLILAIVGIFMLCIVLCSKRSEDIACDYQSIELQIVSKNCSEKIRIWEGENDVFYFFLPSFVEQDSEVLLCNIGKSDCVKFDEIELGRMDNVVEHLEFGKEYTFTLRVSGIWQAPKKVCFMKSENLPVLFIETETGNLDTIHAGKENEDTGTVLILSEQGERELKSRLEYIRCRGNSTFLNYEKKPYQIKLPMKCELFEMEAAQKWILLANAHDDSLVRNEVVFDYARRYTDVQAPQGIYVDAYINGEYVGNYYLCEKVEIGEGRIDIIESGQVSCVEENTQYVSEDGRRRAIIQDVRVDDVTGGYVLERIDIHSYDACVGAFVTNNEMYYRIVEPQHPTVEQVNYIADLFDEIEGAIFSEDGRNPDTGKHYSEYIDVDSWVDKYLIDEVFHDPDTPVASTYLYKDSDKVNSLVISGPVWDYDRAMGGYAVETNFYIDTPQQIKERGIYAEALLKHDEMRVLVQERYFSLLEPYIEDEMAYRIRCLQDKICASAKMDRVRWPQVVGYYEQWEANGEYIVSFMKKKNEFLQSIWEDNKAFHTVTFLDDYGNVYDEYSVLHGEYMAQIPHISSYVAVFNGWYSVESGKRLDLRLPILEDVVYVPRWIDANVLLQNGIAIADIDIESVDFDSMKALLDEVIRMKESVE